MTIEENVLLAPLTTFRIGGPARFFVRVRTIEELKEALAFARAKNSRVLVLGGGSNILVDNSGFEGLVIKIEITGIARKGGTYIAGAGESWDVLVGRAVDDGMWGVENLSGIPGSVGGAVVQNIGAYGQALSQTFEWAEVYDRQDGSIKTLGREVCGFGYRGSIFQNEPDRYVVLHAAFKLFSGATPNIEYKDLAARFGTSSPALRELRRAVIDIRAGKFPDLVQEGTAGSFFKNPTLPVGEARQLQKRYPELPLFPLPESDRVKIPLGWFLDYRHGVLDMRGVTVGNARMYEKQFLVLVAAHHSSSDDIKKLAELVKEKIRAVLRMEVEPEVHFV